MERNLVVLDTCTLLWWTLDPVQLSKRSKGLLDEADTLVVSSISIWEIGIKEQHRQISLGGSFEEYVLALEATDKLEIMAIDHRVWVENLRLKWKHRDPADRTIVAQAKMLSAPLITPDVEIKKFYKATMW